MTVKEITEFKKKVGTIENLTYDALTALYVANREGADKVYDLFIKYGYSLDSIPAEFFRVFAMNKLELAELQKSLDLITELGLKEVFNNNLRPACFKKNFVARVKDCKESGITFLKEDGSFRDELYTEEAFKEYVAKQPVETVSLANETQASQKDSNEEGIASLDEEDLQVYNEIIKTLNELTKENTADVYLSMLANNIISKVVPLLSSKEYRFLSERDMITSIMFDGIDEITPELKVAGRMILSAFPQREQAERGVY